MLINDVVRKHTQINGNSNMVWYVVLPDVNNEITRIYKSIRSFIVILVVVKNVKARVGATASQW